MGDEGDEGAGEARGENFLLLTQHSQFPMPHAPCPMTINF
ncbi:MAG: histidine kinase [Nostoc sp.]